MVPDAGTGRNWIPGRRTAAELAQGTSLPPLTRSELMIAASIASVLGGYLGPLSAPAWFSALEIFSLSLRGAGGIPFYTV